MKTTLALAALLTLAPAALLAQSTDAMPPETRASSSSAQASAMESMPAKPPVKPSQELIVSLHVGVTPLIFSLADLKALPQQTISAIDGHTHQPHTYSGPLVADVLAKAGLPATNVSHKLILNSFAIATGTDGYRVVYSLAELEPLFTSGKVIVCLTQDGQPVASGLQLIDPIDHIPARWVHGLSSLAVSTLPSK